MGKQVRPTEKGVDRELDPEVQRRRRELFDVYVYPYRNMIYKLCMKYSWKRENIEENYTEVLANFYRYVETYDPRKPIKTWLHICTKRHVMNLEGSRHYSVEWHASMGEGAQMLIDQSSNRPSYKELDVKNYRHYFNDDILKSLDELNPIYRDALLLQVSGYSLKEIVDIEHKRGRLKSKNIETIKSRLFVAKKHLKKHLNRDGERVID